MNTILATRSGWFAATSNDVPRPATATPTTARSVAVASITASASAANSSSRYASGSGGRSERPLPRPSNVTTRQWRARYGICNFQCREWMIDHVGSRSTVGLALAVDLVEDADAVPLDVALLVRVAGPRLLARRSRYLDSHPSIQSSSSWWPVSIPDSRSSMIPSLKVITSETSASSGISIP